MKTSVKNLLFIIAWIIMIVCLIIVYKQVYDNKNVKIIDVKTDHVIDEGILYGEFSKEIKLVTWEQKTKASETYVDSNIFGERRTKLNINRCIYQMGIDYNDVHIKGKDDKNGIVYVTIGEPIMINLNIDFDKIDFDKIKGLFRLSMNDKEKKKFYKIAKENVRKEIINNEYVMKKVNESNRIAIEKIIMSTPNVKSVIFQ